MGFDFEAFAAECPSAMVVAADDGRVLFVNRALARLLGFGLAELQTFGLLVPRRLHPPESMGWIRHLGEHVSETGRLTWPLVHRSGVEIETEWSILSGHAPNGRGLAQIVFTRLGAIEPAIVPGTSADQFHQILFENAPMGVFRFNERGVITACNEPFVSLLGSTRSQLIGLHMQTLPDTAIVDVTRKALAGQIGAYDGPYTSATGGKTVYVRLVMAPTFDERGGVSGGVGLADDVTEQRRASGLVARAERLASLGSLAAGVAHEVQNPLAYLLANLDLALRSIDAAPRGPCQELRASLVAAREGAARVAHIARDLKTFSKADESLRGAVDIPAVLETAIKLSQNSIKQRATLTLDIQPVAKVWASESRLVQLFVNLLMNAAESITDGTAMANTIRLSTRTLPDGRIRVDVEDSGRGVAPDAVTRLFDPFWTDKPTGTGLGLAICHGIVCSIGGEIFLDTDRPPDIRGARFSVLLPPSAVSVAPLPMSQPPEPMQSRTDTKPRGRVLIVDDERRLAEALRLSLSPMHDVEVANGGKPALEILRKDRAFDVVLCDVLMPDLRGPELYAIVAEQFPPESGEKQFPELAERFVFLTGGAFSDSTRAFLQRVPNLRIEKPFDLDFLEKLVDERVQFARTSR